MPGRFTSIRTRSGSSVRASSTPSSPVSASPTTSNPSVASTTMRDASRKGSWSSTIRTLIVCFAGSGVAALTGRGCHREGAGTRVLPRRPAGMAPSPGRRGERLLGLPVGHSGCQEHRERLGLVVRDGQGADGPVLQPEGEPDVVGRHLDGPVLGLDVELVEISADSKHALRPILSVDGDRTEPPGELRPPRRQQLDGQASPAREAESVVGRLTQTAPWTVHVPSYQEG